jgi:hypothetical protein
MISADLRYTLRRRRSKDWPAVAGTIDTGVVGLRGPLAGFPSVWSKVHFTYSYSVRGLQHSGRFYLLVRGKKEGEGLRQTLVGSSVMVKYDDRKPEVALVMEEELAGKSVMQGPSWTYR